MERSSISDLIFDRRQALPCNNYRINYIYSITCNTVIGVGEPSDQPESEAVAAQLDYLPKNKRRPSLYEDDPENFPARDTSDLLLFGDSCDLSCQSRGEWPQPRHTYSQSSISMGSVSRM